MRTKRENFFRFRRPRTAIALPVQRAKESDMKNLAWHSKLALALTVFLPVYFVIAALGTKFGIWGWETGLVAMTFRAGLWVLGIVGVVSVISLIIALIKKPRSKLAVGIAVAGVTLPLVIFAGFASARGTAGENPIHDVSTDTANPPEFSQETLAAREESGANPLYDYQTPIGRFEKWESADKKLAIQSHAQIINDRYAALSPLPLAGASREDAVEAVEAAMADMGISNIRSDIEAGRVEGTAETFWFGFKDDVVVRIGEAQIDFRSVSRVGTSDLGANSKRIAELREATQSRIGQR